MYSSNIHNVGANPSDPRLKNNKRPNSHYLQCAVARGRSALDRRRRPHAELVQRRAALYGRTCSDSEPGSSHLHLIKLPVPLTSPHDELHREAIHEIPDERGMLLMKYLLKNKLLLQRSLMNTTTA